MEIVRIMLEKSVHGQAKDIEGVSPLMAAQQASQLAMIRLLSPTPKEGAEVEVVVNKLQDL